MQVETRKVKLSEIKPNPDNPRRINKEKMERLIKSLKEFPEMMDLREIVVDETMTILGGNMRFRALKEAGEKEAIAKIATGLTPDQKKEFIIKDNAPFGEWDMDALANVWSDLPLVEWGIDLPEDWMNEGGGEGLTDPDEVPEVPKVATTKPGDIWLCGKHRVMCGDSTKAEDVERLMDGVKADMVFTDPPYGLGGYGGRNKMALQGDDQDVAPFYNAVPKAREVYVWGRIYNLVDLNFVPRDIIVWKKNNFGLGRGYRGQYEVCFYGGGFDGSDSDVWEVDKDVNYQHPTQKPVALCLRAIKNSKPENILDLFGGSGSTLIAADQTGRTAYLMEIDPLYVDVTVQRWEDYTGEKAVLE